MESYKVCPSCKKKYPANLMVCDACDMELIKEDTPVFKQPKKGNALFRFCECGQKNPSNARKCTKCGEDISDIMPKSEEQYEDKKTAVYQIISLDKAVSSDITEKRLTFGKKSTFDSYLLSKDYVSREQCVLYMENNEPYIENLSRSNGTYVNNKKIEQKTKLTPDDEIGFGGCCINGKRQDGAAYFIIKKK